MIELLLVILLTSTTNGKRREHVPQSETPQFEEFEKYMRGGLYTMYRISCILLWTPSSGCFEVVDVCLMTASVML